VTPRLEAKRMMLPSWASTLGMSLDFVDVVRAYFTLPHEGQGKLVCGIVSR
jgi:hypothetical protein